MAARHALVGGGTGFIGSRLTKHLGKNGYEVTVVSRMPGPQRITWHELSEKGLPNGVTTVINLAGQNVLDPMRRWTPGFKQNVWNSRVNTTASMIKAIQRSERDIGSFINISGVSLYKPCDRVYTEEDKGEGYDFMSNLCLEWENAASLPPESGCRVVKIRTGVVVGRGGGMIQSMYYPFLFGLGGPIGSGKQPLPWIHIDDLCRLIQFSVENEKVSGALNAVAPEVTTNEQFSKQFACSMRRPSLFAVPEFVVKAIFGEERSALLLYGAKVQPKRTLDCGFEFKYPTAKAACDEVVKSSGN